MSSLHCKGMRRKLNLRPICVRSSDTGLDFDVYGLGLRDQLLARRFALRKIGLLNRANEHPELA